MSCWPHSISIVLPSSWRPRAFVQLPHEGAATNRLLCDTLTSLSEVNELMCILASVHLLHAAQLLPAPQSLPASLARGGSSRILPYWIQRALLAPQRPLVQVLGLLLLPHGRKAHAAEVLQEGEGG